MPRLNDRIRIRTAREGDVQAIAELEAMTSQTAWSESSLRYDICENQLALVLLAEESCEASESSLLLGYADAWLVAGEAQLNNIAVNPEYRRQHIAEELLATLILEAGKRACTSINLELRVSNTPAYGLYRKLGFREVGIRENYYEDNAEGAILMDMEIRC